MGTFLTTIPPSDLLGAITTSFSANGADYFLSTQYISDPNGLSWVLTLTIPKTDLWGSLDSTRKQAVLVASFWESTWSRLDCPHADQGGWGVRAGMRHTESSERKGNVFSSILIPPTSPGLPHTPQATKFDFRCLLVETSDRQTSLFREIQKLETYFYTMLEEFADGVQTSHQPHTDTKFCFFEIKGAWGQTLELD
ncbi:hypothetical protein BDK51DRAFT_31238 [Blyttiomyces helicus]|uniref:Uncharacterized protein n=1 Tax=Blyttiomyces helicus TaxID=388810 RepID=A0A4P9W9Y3_9FUNG|nr:hypothetical protein BDK51DRAFT_31238 [Blyttiomyces helicus]|eukprot:RKO88335.1 hypothetical protein BDK51DRAFT_31238 [Blyttiomyces helicus]